MEYNPSRGSKKKISRYLGKKLQRELDTECMRFSQDSGKGKRRLENIGKENS